MRADISPSRSPGKRKVAVIGSGISGLSAAWLLGKSCDITIYEADGRLGGHANTVDVPSPSGKIAVDTGFIVYNDRNYPNLVSMFDHLGVPTSASDMSFSASLGSGDFEYSGSGIRGMLGQKLNVIRPRFWRMLSDTLRFYREAPALLERMDLEATCLGDYLDDSRYSESFVEDHLLPMGAAIWSTTAREMRDYPLHAFIRFFACHGLISLSDRPRWRTVTGGSRAYIQRLIADFSGTIRLNSPVVRIERGIHGVTVTTLGGHADTFSDIVLATHADQALAMLGDDADRQERDLLGAFSYTHNTAVLHSDERLMPRRKAVWSSWNYIGEAPGQGHGPLCVTYWMNRLQNIAPAYQLFVTLNPSRDVAPDRMIAEFDYTHPLFDHKAISAQKQLWRLQGQHGTWFCGAHFGSGFHEDGLQSGLAVAEGIGGLRRPWTVENESGRIVLGETLMAAE